MNMKSVEGARGRLLAHKVIKKLEAGEVPVMQELALEVGYSKNSARKCVGSETKGFKQEMQSYQDKMGGMLKDINSGLIAEIKRRIDNGEIVSNSLRDLVYSVDIGIKNDNLVAGKATAIVEFNVETVQQADKIIDDAMA